MRGVKASASGRGPKQGARATETTTRQWLRAKRGPRSTTRVESRAPAGWGHACRVLRHLKRSERHRSTLPPLRHIGGEEEGCTTRLGHCPRSQRDTAMLSRRGWTAFSGGGPGSVYCLAGAIFRATQPSAHGFAIGYTVHC
ncbi:hypothetical protein MRX96_054076 [Rhipicephalus microplus]